METVYDDLGIHSIEKYINSCTLIFLECMAHLDESSLLVHVACSTAVRNGKLKRGNKPWTTQQAWAKTLLQSGLVREYSVLDCRNNELSKGITGYKHPFLT